jgi:hypothetical protein
VPRNGFWSSGGGCSVMRQRYAVDGDCHPGDDRWLGSPCAHTRPERRPSGRPPRDTRWRSPRWSPHSTTRRRAGSPSSSAGSATTTTGSTSRAGVLRAPDRARRAPRGLRRVAEQYDVHGVARCTGRAARDRRHRGDRRDDGSHRGDAFAASRALIDTLKAEVPIWKHQCSPTARRSGSAPLSGPRARLAGRATPSYPGARGDPVVAGPARRGDGAGDALGLLAGREGRGQVDREVAVRRLGDAMARTRARRGARPTRRPARRSGAPHRRRRTARPEPRPTRDPSRLVTIAG